MFKLYKTTSLILTLCIQLVSLTSDIYNVAKNKKTNLINGQTPYNYNNIPFLTSDPAHINDGIVTYWEQFYQQPQNWPLYLDSLTQGQTQIIDFNSNVTVNSIYICMRDQINFEASLKNMGIGTKIFVGNDLDNGPTSSQNTLCTTLSGYAPLQNVVSQWISCSDSVQGQYLWIQVPSTYGTFFQISEIMVFEYLFVQTNYLAITASSQAIPDNLYLPVQQQNYVLAYNSYTSATNYCFLTNIDALPWYQIQLKASIEIQVVILVSLLAASTPPSSVLYSNNIQVNIDMCDSTGSICQSVGDCIQIVDSSINPESDCGGKIGNQITIQGQANSQLGINSLGILANCVCSKTSFLSQNMHQSQYVNVHSLITSGQSYFTAYLNQPNLQIPLYNISKLTDTISLVCGDGSGITYCGERQLVIWNNDLNEKHILATSNLFSLSGNILSVLTTDASNLGVYNFTLKVQLNDPYDSLGYFPKQTTFILSIQDNDCQLGFCEIGILSDCDCTKTSFSESMMNNQQIQIEIANLFASNITDFRIQLSDDPLYIKLNKISLLIDSVSLVCGDATGSTFCGDRAFAIWDYDNNQEINISDSTLFSFSLDTTGEENLIIQSTSFQDTGKYNLAMRIRLANYIEVGYFPFYTNFTVSVICSPTNIVPVRPQSSFNYQLGSGTQFFKVSNYTQTPSQCFYYLTSIVANLISQTPEAPQQININNSTLQFQLNLINPNLTGLIATYSITAQFQTIDNLDSVINIYFFSDLNQTSSLRLQLPIQTPPIIPYLDQNRANAWFFNFPQVIDTNENEINIEINLNCPDTLQIFKKSIKNSILSLTLDTSKQNLKIGGEYLCQFNYSNGLQSFIENVQFIVEYAKNNQELNGSLSNNSIEKFKFITPIPTIVKITNRGIVFVKWNVAMQNLSSSLLNVKFNQTAQSKRILADSNITNPIYVQIQAGSIYTNQSNLFVNGYSIIHFQEKDLQIQLYFNNQGYVSAASKDSLVMNFSQGYFYSVSNMSLQSNFQIGKQVLPRQITPSSFTIDFGQTSQGILYSMAITAVIGSPLFQYFANQILSIIEPLTVITHYILINLNYPANIQDFFSQLFPLIQFDVFQTTDLYQLIFNISEINDGPINDQFNSVGYTNILTINNIGSLLLFIIFQPILLLVLLPMRWFLRNCNGFIGRHLKNFINSKLDDLKWNGIIQFYFSAYLVLSMIGWISIKDLRFGSNFTSTENFSSILGIFLAAFSILFPILIVVIYKRGYKTLRTFNPYRLARENQIQVIKMLFAKYGNIRNYEMQSQSYKERKEFIRQKGGLIQDLRTTHLGLSINQIIGFPLMYIFSDLLIIVAVLGLIEFQVLAIFLVMNTVVMQMCYLMSVKPHRERVNYYKDIFNHSTKLFLTYILITFTDFVDLSVSDSGGNYFLYVLLLNIGVNILIALIFPLQQVFKYLKYLCKRYKRKSQNQKRQKQLELSKITKENQFQDHMIQQQKLQLLSFMQIDELPKQDKQTYKTIYIRQKSNKNQQSNTKIFDTKTTPYQQFTKVDIFVPKVEDIEAQNQSNKLLINSQQSRSSQLQNLEQGHIDKDTSDFAKQYQQEYEADQDKAEETFDEEGLNKKGIIKNIKKTQWNDQKFTKSIMKKPEKPQIQKVKFQEPIGMTDISKWQRHWDYAFKPQSDDNKLNTKEAETYINYLKTRKLILEWDKPPTFKDLNLTQLCQIAYKNRIIEINQEIDKGYEETFQKRQLRELVAEKLLNQPEFQDDNSRIELFDEIYDLHKRKY